MKNNALKLIPLLGIFSVIFYFLHVILGEIFYEGYNPLAQAISDLTASNSPSKNIAKIFSMLYGICAVLFSIVDINDRGNVNKYNAKRIFWRCRTDKCIFNNNIYRNIVIIVYYPSE